MKVNVSKIDGPWDAGFALDWQIVRSIYLGDDENGHAQFDTERTEVGESLHQLKYKNDQNQIDPIASVIVREFGTIFTSTDIVIPMPASKQRVIQPVYEVAKAVATKMQRTYREDLLLKTQITPQMKDLKDLNEKQTKLQAALKYQDVLPNGKFNILIIDDLFSSGASLQVASQTLKLYPKVNHVYVAAVTRTKNS